MAKTRVGWSAQRGRFSGREETEGKGGRSEEKGGESQSDETHQTMASEWGGVRALFWNYSEITGKGKRPSIRSQMVHTFDWKWVLSWRLIRIFLKKMFAYLCFIVADIYLERLLGTQKYFESSREFPLDQEELRLFLTPVTPASPTTNFRTWVNI